MQWRKHNGDWYADSTKNENYQWLIYQLNGVFRATFVQKANGREAVFPTFEDAKRFCEEQDRNDDDTGEFVACGHEGEQLPDDAAVQETGNPVG
jgi:hypothetical protein